MKLRTMCAALMMATGLVSSALAVTGHGLMLVRDERILDMSTTDTMYEISGSVFSVKIGVTQGMRGELVGVAMVQRSGGYQTATIPITGRLSVYGTRPVRVQMRGVASFQPQPVSFKWEGSGYGSGLPGMVTIKWGADTEQIGMLAPMSELSGIEIDLLNSQFARTNPSYYFTGPAVGTVPYSASSIPMSYVFSASSKGNLWSAASPLLSVSMYFKVPAIAVCTVRLGYGTLTVQEPNYTGIYMSQNDPD